MSEDRITPKSLQDIDTLNYFAGQLLCGMLAVRATSDSGFAGLVEKAFDDAEEMLQESRRRYGARARFLKHRAGRSAAVREVRHE